MDGLGKATVSMEGSMRNIYVLISWKEAVATETMVNIRPFPIDGVGKEIACMEGRMRYLYILSPWMAWDSIGTHAAHEVDILGFQDSNTSFKER